MALSREIPPAIRLVADPIVRRVSRNSLLVSLQQTEDAVRNREALTPRSADNPTLTGRFGSMQRSFTSKAIWKYRNSLSLRIGMRHALKNSETTGQGLALREE